MRISERLRRHARSHGAGLQTVAREILAGDLDLYVAGSATAGSTAAGSIRPATMSSATSWTRR